MYTIQSKKRKNSKHFDKDIFQTEKEQEIKDYLTKNNLTITGKPYIFTHLPLNNGMIITCSYHNIICSPSKLADFLSFN